jgi:hypothetical protein
LASCDPSALVGRQRWRRRQQYGLGGREPASVVGIVLNRRGRARAFSLVVDRIAFATPFPRHASGRRALLAGAVHRCGTWRGTQARTPRVRVFLRELRDHFGELQGRVAKLEESIPVCVRNA